MSYSRILIDAAREQRKNAISCRHGSIDFSNRGMNDAANRFMRQSAEYRKAAKRLIAAAKNMRETERNWRAS